MYNYEGGREEDEGMSGMSDWMIREVEGVCRLEILKIERRKASRLH